MAVHKFKRLSYVHTLYMGVLAPSLHSGSTDSLITAVMRYKTAEVHAIYTTT